MTVDSAKAITPEDRAAVQAVLRRVADDDARCSFGPRSLTFEFTALDFAGLEREASSAAPAEPDLFSRARNGSSAAGEMLSALAARIGRIRSYGIRAGRRVYVGYADERKVRGRKEKVERRGQFYYARDHGFDPRNVDAPESLANRIICADSLAALREFPDNSVDLILTSPPYNFGLAYQDQQDAAHWPAYFERLFAILDQCVRVLKFGGRLALNVQPLFSDYIPAHHIISSHLMGRRLIWKGEILWEKNNYNCKYTAWGSWRSPSNPYLKYTWEFIEVFSKGSLTKAGNGTAPDIRADEFKKWVVARWNIAPEREMRRFGHPAMFPEELAARVIKLFSYPGDLVLDPFNGAGTTTVVAKKLGRRYLGIDISPEYCSTAEARVGGILFEFV